MPNHVDHKLTVVGSAEDVAAFVATARGAAPCTGDVDTGGPFTNATRRLRIEPLNFHLIAPLPDSFSERPYGNDGSHGYHLQRQYWGGKWGPYNDTKDATLSHDGTRATYEFRHAWGLPKEAFRRASLRYGLLRFYVSYGGEGPCRGRGRFVKGRADVVDDPYDASEYPTEADHDADEEAASNRYDAVVNQRLAQHDTWVDESEAAL